jgi:hypothetical protein
LALDITRDELAAAARKRHYVVDLNGTAPSAFLSALAGLGISRERIRPEELDLESALMQALASRSEAEGS